MHGFDSTENTHAQWGKVLWTKAYFVQVRSTRCWRTAFKINKKLGDKGRTGEKVGICEKLKFYFVNFIVDFYF